MRWVAIGLILGHMAWCADILSPNDETHRSLGPNEIHEYSLPGSADAYSELEVEPQGARIEVEIASRAQPLILQRLEGAHMLPTTFCWVSTEPAPTLLRVRSLE